MKQAVYSAIEKNYVGENDLTINMMYRAVDRFNITDPKLLDLVHSGVSFITGDWPEGEGFGSSDATAVMQSVEDELSSSWRVA